MAKPQHGGLEAANRRIESADHEIDSALQTIVDGYTQLS